MNFVEGCLKKPHLLASLVVLAAVVGFIGYRRMPVNLFPDTERPQIAVVSVYPGASAADVEAEVSRPIEQELNTLELVRRVTSVSKDEVSVVAVEFEYREGLDAAATDVANGLQGIKAQLPASLQPPMISKVSSATPAVLTLALQPQPGSPLDLSMVRQLADNEIKDRLLQIPEVADVEVFGAHRPAVRADLDRDKLERFGLTANDVSQSLIAFNANQPIGRLIASRSQFLLKRIGEFQSLADVGRITVALLASYVISVTVIPLLAPLLSRRTNGAGRNWLERIVHRFDTGVVEPVRDSYVRLTAFALKHRFRFLPPTMILLVLSLRQMPLVGRDLMPPMDAGIVQISFETDANTSLKQAEHTLAQMEKIILQRPEVTSVSSVLGSEPAVVSFGSGTLPQQGNITVHLIDRFHREAAIWQIEDELRGIRPPARLGGRVEQTRIWPGRSLEGEN